MALSSILITWLFKLNLICRKGFNMQQEILNIINTVLSNKDRKKLDSITADMDLRNDIGFDSFDLAELTVRVEAEYDIDIFEDGLVDTVGEVLEKLKNAE